jgi:hypothetical protein
MSVPEDRDALTRLEEALSNIGGLAHCLNLMGASRYNDTAFTYLGGQLQDHHEAAREAFDEIFAAANNGGQPGDDQAETMGPGRAQEGGPS